jgi:23S rRNA-/tRNA-specific pseudouridylate synthase
MGSVTLVADTPDILAVCKPPSMPMHPCGAYRDNSLVHVLKREPLLPGTPPQLHLVHRLDRVTSGPIPIAV